MAECDVVFVGGDFTLLNCDMKGTRTGRELCRLASRSENVCFFADALCVSLRSNRRGEYLISPFTTK